MTEDVKFDVAISFSSDDSWIGKDLAALLNQIGLNTYFSPSSPDLAGGFFRQKLANIYNHSTVNLLIYSESYASKPKDSIVYMEKSILWDRHIGRSEHESLFILGAGNLKCPDEFSMCLFHRINDIGLLKARDCIVDRIVTSYKAEYTETTNYTHPKGKEVNRGAIRPCKFRLSRNYKQDKLRRWASIADVLVVPLSSDVPKELKTYLIPSGDVPPFLCHTAMLRTNPQFLARKSELSEMFVLKYLKEDLHGGLFYIKYGDMEYPHIYCKEYDKFLFENYSKAAD